MNELKNRYEFVLLFDVENGNPNGDPDASNMPRVDPETNIGIVTDVCIKRKIRNYVEIAKNKEKGFDILIKTDKALNEKYTDAYKVLDLKLDLKGKVSDSIELAKNYICENYYDVRTFGAVMSTGNNQCGIVRGPVQLNFARSIDPVFPQEITITRQAITSEKDFNNKKTEMGKKSFVPYGLYRMEGYVSAFLANKTNFTTDDLELLWESLENMFEIDHSAARGKLCIRKLYIFEHDSILGKVPSSKLFDSIVITKKADIEVPRKFSDYDIEIKEIDTSVKLYERL